MTPEQRYLFDLQGFLHLESALSDAELSAAQNALSCLESIPDEELPPELNASTMAVATRTDSLSTRPLSILPCIHRSGRCSKS